MTRVMTVVFEPLGRTKHQAAVDPRSNPAVVERVGHALGPGGGGGAGPGALALTALHFELAAGLLTRSPIPTQSRRRNETRRIRCRGR
jgi:hypothetical protein